MLQSRVAIHVSPCVISVDERVVQRKTQTGHHLKEELHATAYSDYISASDAANRQICATSPPRTAQHEGR